MCHLQCFTTLSFAQSSRYHAWYIRDRNKKFVKSCTVVEGDLATVCSTDKYNLQFFAQYLFRFRHGR